MLSHLSGDGGDNDAGPFTLGVPRKRGVHALRLILPSNRAQERPRDAAPEGEGCGDDHFPRPRQGSGRPVEARASPPLRRLAAAERRRDVGSRRREGGGESSRCLHPGGTRDCGEVRRRGGAQPPPRNDPPASGRRGEGDRHHLRRRFVQRRVSHRHGDGAFPRGRGRAR